MKNGTRVRKSSVVGNTLKFHKVNLKSILQGAVGDRLVSISVPMNTE